MSDTAIVRDGIGGQEIERRGETATSALVAAARAEVEAKYFMAMKRPRDDDQVRASLLRACQRTTFAENAYFSVERFGAEAEKAEFTRTDGVVEGLSIRFVEEMVRKSGNMAIKPVVTYEDDEKRIITVTVSDYETNAEWSRTITISKRVERTFLRDKQIAIATRTNTAGKKVFIVAATDDELTTKENAAISKAARTLALKLCPSDTIEDCKEQIRKTITANATTNPEAARKALVDGFAKVNVSPVELKAYLGHEIATCSPKETLALRGLYAALRDGETTWADVMGDKTRGAEEAAAQAGGEPKKTKAEKLAERVSAKASPAASPPEAAKAVERSPDGEIVPEHVGREPGDDSEEIK